MNEYEKKALIGQLEILLKFYGQEAERVKSLNLSYEVKIACLNGIESACSEVNALIRKL